MSNDPNRPKPDSKKITGITQKQATEATEVDLWDLDSEDSDLPNPVTVIPSTSLPSKRATDGKSLQSKKPTERHIDPPQAKTEKPAAKEYPAEVPAAEEIPETAPAEPSEVSPEPNEVSADAAESDDDAPQSDPISPIAVISSLSKIERIAISVLVAVLALGATLTYIHFVYRVPTRSPIAEKIDFPITGKIVEITEGVTYWREPIKTGENADVVRRGTQLIPVLKMNVKSNSGAIRVFFRNQEGLVVGDGITRTVKGEREITIGATAGFDDVGMHTSYRTGDSEPWVVQVFEAPSSTAPREQFGKVLEMEISPLVR